jgi:hypothetical protein
MQVNALGRKQSVEHIVPVQRRAVQGPWREAW